MDDYDLAFGYLKPGKRTVHHEAVDDEHGAWDEQVEIRTYVPFPEDVIESIRTAPERMAAKQRREMMLREVQQALVTAQINILPADDATALRWQAFYPAWASGTVYEAGYRVQHGDKLYRCIQAHTSQEDWAPDAAASLWAEICESHAGTIDDPIPYSGNMALEAGKYYTQDGAAYRCFRDTGIPVYNALTELVGLYVEAAQT